jgi:hypothetical protein
MGHEQAANEDQDSAKLMGIKRSQGCGQAPIETHVTSRASGTSRPRSPARSRASNIGSRPEAMSDIRRVAGNPSDQLR